ncbi:Phosphoenolpyruvate/pyruvate domain-containing protein [Mycena vulgaris]|nr:Phosphoenolpyruvate/pyruvate domain-containing protein [Mycena vulgaris]
MPPSGPIARPNLVKQQMEAGEIAHSLGLRIVLSTEIALMAQRAGYHALLMNLEHSATGLETASAVSTACLNVGYARLFIAPEGMTSRSKRRITPMVVVPTNSQEWISRSLDAGAQAVIVPHVDTVAGAQSAVNAAKYPPIGKRSITMFNAITQYTTGLHFEAMAKVSNDTTLIMPMIETREGLDNVKEIAAVDGIDVLLVGCGDLCVDLGIPNDHDSPIFHEAIAQVAAAADAASTPNHKVFVGLGGLEARPELMEKFVKEHACIRYLMAGRDIVHLFNGMKAQAKKMAEMNERIRS